MVHSAWSIWPRNCSVRRELYVLHNDVGFVRLQRRHDRSRIIEYLEVVVGLEHRLRAYPYEFVMAYDGDSCLSTTHVNSRLGLD